ISSTAPRKSTTRIRSTVVKHFVTLGRSASRATPTGARVTSCSTARRFTIAAWSTTSRQRSRRFTKSPSSTISWAIGCATAVEDFLLGQETLGEARRPTSLALAAFLPLARHAKESPDCYGAVPPDLHRGDGCYASHLAAAKTGEAFLLGMGHEECPSGK